MINVVDRFSLNLPYVFIPKLPRTYKIKIMEDTNNS